MGHWRFSQWFPLTDGNIQQVPSKPGVYEIRCKGKSVQRLLGKDDDGILDIGESLNLQTRLRTFLRCASDSNKGGHAAGMTFARLKLRLSRKGFLVDKLEFRWKTTDSKDEAYEAEGELLDAYVSRFGELPPLNYKFNWSNYEDA